MSFKENAYLQMSFTDSFSGLTAREQKPLEKSWAKVLPMKYSLPLMKSLFPFYTAIRKAPETVKKEDNRSIEAYRREILDRDCQR